jgi:hypothetical protein
VISIDGQADELLVSKSDHIEIGTNGPPIFADAMDYHGFSATIRRIRKNPGLILLSQSLLF